MANIFNQYAPTSANYNAQQWYRNYLSQNPNYIQTQSNMYQNVNPSGAQNNQSLATPNNGSMFGSISNWWKNQSNPMGISTADMNQLTSTTDANGNPIRTQAEADKNAIALGSQKTGWEQIGSTASGLGSLAGGLAGAYTAYQNAEYQKRQEALQNRMIASDNANKSAFARAAGGTYVPA